MVNQERTGSDISGRNKQQGMVFSVPSYKQTVRNDRGKMRPNKDRESELIKCICHKNHKLN